MRRLNYGRKAIKKSVEDYEKKNHLRLHAIPFAPFLRWIFASSAKIIMPIVSAISVASAINLATGLSITAGSLGFFGTLLTLPLAVKIIGLLLGVIILVSVPVIGSIIAPSIETGQEISDETGKSDALDEAESEESDSINDEGENSVEESTAESAEESSAVTTKPISYQFLINS